MFASIWNTDSSGSIRFSSTPPPAPSSPSLHGVKKQQASEQKFDSAGDLEAEQGLRSLFYAVAARFTFETKL